MLGVSLHVHLAAFSVLIPTTLCITYLFKGEACILRDGSDGICGTFSDCGSAFSFPRNPPVLCSPNSREGDIICCPPGYINKVTPTAMPTTTPTTTTTTASTPTPRKHKEYEDTETCSLLTDRDPKQIKESLSGKACRMYEEVYEDNSEAQHILGGQIVEDMGNFPFMAALGYTKTVPGDVPKIEYKCGGMLISDRFVLTAAHCEKSQSPVVVKMGAVNMTDVDPNAKLFEVEKFIAHPCYNMTESYYDIALVKLTKAIKVSNYIFPACISMDPEPEVDRDYNVLGWGATTVSGFRLSKSLLMAFLRVQHPDECSLKWPPDTNNLLPEGFKENTMICAINPVKGATCKGDSGGPLSLRNPNIHFTVVGVISQGGSACGDIDRPDILTKIYPFLLWIEDVIWPDRNIKRLEWDEDTEDDDCAEGSGLSC